MIDSKDINDLHPALKKGAEELIRRMKEKGYPVGISSTYRDIEFQNNIYAQGRTKPGKIITNAKGGLSMHNYKLAFDIFKNVKGEAYSDSLFFKTAGEIWTQMGGEWGGSWQKFVDMPHFQFTNGLSLSQIQKGATVPQDAKMKWEITQTIMNSIASYKVKNISTNLNIRKESRIDSEIVGKLRSGDVVNVSLIKNGFGKISNGWVSIIYLEKQ